MRFNHFIAMEKLETISKDFKISFWKKPNLLTAWRQAGSWHSTCGEWRDFKFPFWHVGHFIQTSKPSQHCCQSSRLLKPQKDSIAKSEQNRIFQMSAIHTRPAFLTQKVSPSFPLPSSYYTFGTSWDFLHELSGLLEQSVYILIECDIYYFFLLEWFIVYLKRPLV